MPGKVKNNTVCMDKQVTPLNYIKQSVEQLIKDHETRDPYRMAQAMGIDVDEFPFRRIKGLILEITGKVTIVLNSNLPEWLKRVVLAHELGHRQLSPQGMGYFFLAEHTLMESKVEYEANRFTVELLTWGEEPEIEETVEHFAARMGLPVEMMRYRVVI
jgi:Zn-dependent peptidase ImmA (M78 family)